jgi:capsular polysaccharide export protein
MSETRTVLFLQGHPSTFASDVAREIEKRGGRALRINFCWADKLFWRAGNAVDYRGTLDDWPEFLRAFISRERVTDVVYYADRLPYHRAAATVARDMGVLTATYEFGYLRPDWITLERGGMSAFSHFPRDPAAIRRIAAAVPEPDLVERYVYTFLDEAVAEVTYNLAAILGRPFYRHYESDKYYHPLLDYLSYIPRLLASRSAKKHANAVVSRLIEQKTAFYLCPMQMQNDYQLRANSAYRHQSEMLEEVIASFAANAPGESHLVFKLHPLDNGIEGWPRIVAELTRTHGVTDRVHLILGSDLKTLITNSRGIVVVNSTVGVHAIRHGRPVKVLGAALYDITGLTFQQPLDDFWRAATPPDPELCKAFVRAMAGTIQVKGNFFTRAGRAIAVPEFATRLLEGRVNAARAFVDPPPRLSRALALGVPFILHEAALAAGQKPAPAETDTAPDQAEPISQLRSWRRLAR